jgi:choline dehydrogenase
MLSGIGPASDLRSLGIEVRHEIKGVEKNLHDHIYAHCLASVDSSFSINPMISSNWRMLPEVLRYIVFPVGDCSQLPRLKWDYLSGPIPIPRHQTFKFRCALSA